jgi:hypothetical protein
MPWDPNLGLILIGNHEARLVDIVGMVGFPKLETATKLQNHLIWYVFWCQKRSNMIHEFLCDKSRKHPQCQDVGHHFVHLEKCEINDNPPKTAVRPVQTMRSPNPLP